MEGKQTRKKLNGTVIHLCGRKKRGALEHVNRVGTTPYLGNANGWGAVMKQAALCNDL